MISCASLTKGFKFSRCMCWLFLNMVLAACVSPTPLPTPVLPAPTIHLSPMPTAASTLAPTYTPAATETPLPIPTSCRTPGQMELGAINSVYAGEFRFRVYLPPCYGLDGRFYPTLYLLPGNIHTDSLWDELGMDETAEIGINHNIYPPLLIIMADGGPIANNTSGGFGSYESVILAELIPFIEANYCAWGDANGRAIGGISRGGYWALEIAFRHPEQFISVGGHSAALYDIAAGSDLNPQYTGLTHDLGDLRIYLDIGSSDALIPNIRRLHEDMAADEIEHTWVLNEGGHEDAYWSAHLDDYLGWYTSVWSSDRSTYPPCP